MIFDGRACDLGEGPLWHPTRKQLFWFDIVGSRMLAQTPEGPQEWQFGQRVSAAGWISDDELLIASETGLFRFHLGTGAREVVAEVEAENPVTRSNDGRADRQGGFWFGTMSKRGGRDPSAGAIYRYYRGEVRVLYAAITIPNAICFSPDGRTAHFADTVTHKVMRVALDSTGWPVGEPEVYLDFTREALLPDGAVCDAAGNLWLALWGSSRVACHAPDGTLLRFVGFDAPHTSCPALGGEGLTTLFCTTALEGMNDVARLAHPGAGMTFSVTDVARGLNEPRVIL
jgi:sugar lactone lactonase YvrE